MNAGLLDGLKIVDFSTLLPGPYHSRQVLASLGFGAADVERLMRTGAMDPRQRGTT